MEDKLDIIISLLKKMIPTQTLTSNEADTAAYLIAGSLQPDTLEQSLYEEYITKHKQMNITSPPMSIRNFNKLVRDMNDDIILKNTTKKGVQVRIWKEK